MGTRKGSIGVTPNSAPVELKKVAGTVSEDIESRANHRAAAIELEAAIEGLNRLAREQAAQKPAA